jgi:hypothetical protein
VVLNGINDLRGKSSRNAVKMQSIQWRIGWFLVGRINNEAYAAGSRVVKKNLKREIPSLRA